MACSVCGDPNVVAKKRCEACRRFLLRNGTDRTEKHVIRLTERDIERDLARRGR